MDGDFWDFGSLSNGIGLKTLFFLNPEKDTNENINLWLYLIVKKEAWRNLESQSRPVGARTQHWVEFLYQRIKVFSGSSARYTQTHINT